MNHFSLENSLFQHAAVIRLGCFFGVFAVMALWESLRPRRPLSQPKIKRWADNLGITFTGMVLVRLLFAAGATGAAALFEKNGWGFFAIVHAPYWVKVLVSVLALDFIIYMQHFVFHHAPLLWRLHMMHHTDLDLDVTSGARFHPLEILLSMFIKLGAVFLLGAPALAVLVFEVLLNATAMFNHSNVLIPGWLDRALRLFIVTPDMHRVHHSVIIREFNSNFGFNLSLWDRIMGTYRAQPAKGHLGMTLGLARFREAGRLHYWSLIKMPFGGIFQRNA